MDEIRQETTEAMRRRGLSGGTLKLLALLLMTVDHLAAAWVVQSDAAYTPMRIIGRLAFPIFCFLSAEALAHSRNTLKYTLRLFLFAVISEIPFDLAIFSIPFFPEEQNVFFTLGAAALFVALWQRCRVPEHYLGTMLAGIAAIMGAHYLHFDYGAPGVLLIWVFYGLRDKPPALRMLAAALLSVLAWTGIQLWALAALPLLLLYDGRRGRGLPKYLFYVFYPAHLLLFWFLRVFVLG